MLFLASPIASQEAYHLSGSRRKLTEKLVASLRPGRRDQFFWDTRLPGFGVRVRPSGAIYFIVQYRTLGRQQRRRKIGVATVTKVEQARNRAKNVLNAVAEGRDPALERDAVRSGKTIA